MDLAGSENVKLSAPGKDGLREAWAAGSTARPPIQNAKKGESCWAFCSGRNVIPDAPLLSLTVV